MILELLKVRSLIADRRVAAAENRLARRYQRRNRIEEMLDNYVSKGTAPLTLEDVQELLKNDASISLTIGGKQATLVSLPDAPQERTVEVPAADAETEAAKAKAKVKTKTIVVPDPTDELMAEIEATFRDVSFSADEVSDAVSGKHLPKTVTRVEVAELPEIGASHVLSRITILNPEDESEPVASGVFIESAAFDGCGDEDCDCCDDEEDEGTVLVRLIPDNMGGKIDCIELSSELVAELTR